MPTTKHTLLVIKSGQVGIGLNGVLLETWADGRNEFWSKVRSFSVVPVGEV